MKKISRVMFRRSRGGRTDYRYRLKLLLGKLPRLVVRKSNKHFRLQIAEYTPTGDVILAQASTQALEKAGWKASTGSTPSAYLCGMLLAKKALQKNVKECILDIGLNVSVKGSSLYAAVKGAVDGGLKVRCGTDVFPSQERIRGEHIAAYAKKLKQEGSYEKVFSGVAKKGLDAEKLPQHFEEMKKKIIGV